MAKLRDKYPDDLDVTALYAESLMVLNPWVLWVKGAEPPGEIVAADGKTLIAKAVLERVSQADTRQPLGFFFVSAIEPRSRQRTLGSKFHHIPRQHQAFSPLRPPFHTMF